MTFTYAKSKLANGQPSIEVSGWQHSQIDFEAVLKDLARACRVDQPTVEVLGPKAVPEVLVYTAALCLNGEPVEISMDDFSFSLSFASEETRDRILALIVNKA